MQQRQELVMKTFKTLITFLAILTTFNASPLMSMNPRAATKLSTEWFKKSRLFGFGILIGTSIKKPSKINQIENYFDRKHLKKIERKQQEAADKLSATESAMVQAIKNHDLQAVDEILDSNQPLWNYNLDLLQNNSIVLDTVLEYKAVDILSKILKHLASTNNFTFDEQKALQYVLLKSVPNNELLRLVTQPIKNYWFLPCTGPALNLAAKTGNVQAVKLIIESKMTTNDTDFIAFLNGIQDFKELKKDRPDFAAIEKELTDLAVQRCSTISFNGLITNLEISWFMKYFLTHEKNISENAKGSALQALVKKLHTLTNYNHTLEYLDLCQAVINAELTSHEMQSWMSNIIKTMQAKLSVTPIAKELFILDLKDHSIELNLLQAIYAEDTAVISAIIKKDKESNAVTHNFFDFALHKDISPKLRNFFFEQYSPKEQKEKFITLMNQNYDDFIATVARLRPYDALPESIQQALFNVALKNENWTLAKELKPDLDFSNKFAELTTPILNDKSLTLQEQSTLLQAYKKLDLAKILTAESAESVQALQNDDVAKLPMHILEKHMPIFAYKKSQENDKNNKIAQQERETFLHGELCPFGNPYAYQAPIEESQRTLTQQVSDKILNQNDNLEHYFFNKTENSKRDPNFYKAGYVAALSQTGIYQQITQTEQQFLSDGYEPFYHGRDWEWNFVNDIWNMICAIKQNNSTLSNAITLRFRSENEDLNALQNYRQKLIEKGAAFHIGTGTDKKGKESEVTFMNRTIASNSNYHGECSGTYFLDNCSVAKSGAGWEKIEEMFEQEKLSSYFLHYKKELQELYDAHKNANNFGEILCVGFAQETLDEMVYPAISGGFKVKNNKKTTSQLLKDCKQRLKTDPKFIDAEHMFYCFAVSDLPGEYGDKYVIKSLNLADPEKYGAYVQARDELFEKIKLKMLYQNELKKDATL
jgi:hypothetical protein